MYVLLTRINSTQYLTVIPQNLLLYILAPFLSDVIFKPIKEISAEKFRNSYWEPFSTHWRQNSFVFSAEVSLKIWNLQYLRQNY